jgi:RNA polymerase sigma factor (TIGR02999 family)
MEDSLNQELLMSDVTRILQHIEQGNLQASEQLLPLVYDELRKLAAQRMAQEQPGQMLQATALVHEAYLRLVDTDTGQHWNSRGHFFAAAAEAMRRILVEQAREKARLKRGGDRDRVELTELYHPSHFGRTDEVLAVHEALDKLKETNPQAAELVQLRYFAGLTNKETASLLGISARKANQIWAYARAWLLAELKDEMA